MFAEQINLEFIYLISFSKPISVRVLRRGLLLGLVPVQPWDVLTRLQNGGGGPQVLLRTGWDN